MLIPKTWRFNNNKIVSGGNDRSNEKLSKSKKFPTLKYVFIFLRLAFIKI